LTVYVGLTHVVLGIEFKRHSNEFPSRSASRKFTALETAETTKTPAVGAASAF